ncbi:Hypothetical predicted protein, partial [Marmota monax]
TRGLQIRRQPTKRLVEPSLVATSAAAIASYLFLHATLLPQELAATTVSSQSYSQESKTIYLEDLPPLLEYELAPSNLQKEVDDIYLIGSQGLPWSCTVEYVLNFFSDCRIHNSENVIHFLLNRDGKQRGDALIEMESEQDVHKA